MVGLESLLWAYQNSGPALLVMLSFVAGYVYRHDILPRLQEVEQTQEERAERWEDQQLNAQERTLLLDDAHERVDDVEKAVQRLKKRVRGIEQALAAERGDAYLRGGDSDHNGDRDVDVDTDGQSVGGDD